MEKDKNINIRKNRIQKLRTYYRLTQIELSRLSNVAHSTIRYIELHKSFARLSTLIKILNGFRKHNKNLENVDLEFLFE